MILLLLLSCSVDEYPPTLLARWKDPPTVEVCIDTAFTVEEVQEALDWWQELSPNYEYNDLTTSSCINSPRGLIRITYMEEDPQIGGTTHRKYYPTTDPEMRSAIISIEDTAPFWHLLHELGHAWGWNHTPEEDHSHLMCRESCTLGTEGLDTYPLMIK